MIQSPSRSLPFCLLTAAFVLAGWGPAVAAELEGLTVFPSEVRLNDARESVQLVVLAKYSDGEVRDFTRESKYVVENAKLAKVESASVTPLADGDTKLTITAGGRSTVVSIHVGNFAKPRPISFVNGALVAISKQGCNSGACHGSPSGKGGFRLSLRAFDAKLDELTLIREDFGRRTNVLKPDQSLLLQKPLMKTPHGGGLKLRKSDAAYAVLRDWIAEGRKPDAADSPQVWALRSVRPAVACCVSRRIVNSCA